MYMNDSPKNNSLSHYYMYMYSLHSPRTILTLYDIA